MHVYKYRDSIVADVIFVKMHKITKSGILQSDFMVQHCAHSRVSFNQASTTKMNDAKRDGSKPHCW